MKLHVGWDYDTFCKKTARILGCLVDELNIGYLAGKQKTLKGKLTPRVLEDVGDYDEMIKDAVEAIVSECAWLHDEQK
jgi:hypothetical protein